MMVLQSAVGTQIFKLLQEHSKGRNDFDELYEFKIHPRVEK